MTRGLSNILLLLIGVALGSIPLLHAQVVKKPAIPNVAGPTTSAELRSIMTDAVGVTGPPVPPSPFNSTAPLLFCQPGTAANNCAQYNETGQLLVPAAWLGMIVENKGSTCQPVTIGGGGTITIDLGLGFQNFCITHTAALRVLTITNCPTGQITGFQLWITSDGTSPQYADDNLMWANANVFWPNGVPPVLTTSPNSMDIITVRTKNHCATWGAVVAVNVGGG